jgi:hypothetical protein
VNAPSAVGEAQQQASVGPRFDCDQFDHDRPLQVTGKPDPSLRSG